jgi:ectoine hydroxylase-related dioxygenase (phytanoyl-CoA dioxygenase family)
MAPVAAQQVDGRGNASSSKIPRRLYCKNEPPSLLELQKLCTGRCLKEEYPLATDVSSNIPIYDLSCYQADDKHKTSALQDEWHHSFMSGPGVLVLKSLFPNSDLLYSVNSIFSCIIEEELATARGDHFAPSGLNSRIWNSFQKHAIRDPTSFLQYYSNAWLQHICKAWLGPAYQITAQLNLVRPGGQPQVSHRDYHLGFQTAEACAYYPKTMHLASQFLTLQGGVAHSDIPLESGPTRFLPFSQMFEEGFMAYRLPEFQAYFDQHWVSLPLQLGDAVFFNPALFHAAGENRTSDVGRSVNLLQVSSAFGKTMEKIDTFAIIDRCYDQLRKKYEHEGMSLEVQAAIAAIADGYPFPTNLDRRPPAPGGMAPESEADVLRTALQDSIPREEVVPRLNALRTESMP